jgi:hypothetical protein
MHGLHDGLSAWLLVVMERALALISIGNLLAYSCLLYLSLSSARFLAVWLSLCCCFERECQEECNDCLSAFSSLLYFHKWRRCAWRLSIFAPDWYTVRAHTVVSAKRRSWKVSARKPVKTFILSDVESGMVCTTEHDAFAANVNPASQALVHDQCKS